MTKIFINGEIVDSKTPECFSPTDLKEKLEAIDPNEDLEVEITSEGGSVFAGVQIANMLARHEGKVTTHAVGICASIATVILMAGDKICVDDNCFCLIHLPWTTCQGNAKDMLKEIDALKKCETAMMGYYTKHSKVPTEVLTKYLEDETWFLGNEFAEVFDCEVVASDKVLNIAAKMKKFKNMPKKFFNNVDILNEGTTMEKEELKEEVTEEVKEETSQQEEVVEQQEEVVEQEETPVEQPEEEKKEDDPMAEEEFMEPEETKPTYEELEKTIEELKKKIEELEKAASEEKNVSEDECQKRVSGMQAKMQLKINDFANQLKIKNAALKAANDRVDSLTKDFEACKKELSDMTTAYEAKDNALATLNASVNKLPEETPTLEDGLAKCSTPAERVKFLTSGKYTR